MSAKQTARPTDDWRSKVYEVIFEADTPAGKLFDVILLIAIVLSIAAVVLESVGGVEQQYGEVLGIAEWVFTILFTIEYILRLIVVRRPLGYALSFLGIVDLLAILPGYLAILHPGAESLIVVRTLRLLRIFRLFKLSRYVRELSALTRAVRATSAKIAVFLFVMMAIVLILGTLMYVIEGEQHGFTSIPRGIYWAIVTVTTVGYGDIAPSTAFGQAIAAAAMVIGYSLIIIPTGIFSVELLQASRHEITTQVCPDCAREGHDPDADYCKYCGGRL